MSKKERPEYETDILLIYERWQFPGVQGCVYGKEVGGTGDRR